MLILLFKKNGKPLVYFRRYKDHRMNRQKAHKMEDIIAITLFAVICGAESWYEVEDFGKKKQAWLSSFLELLADTKGLEECVLANGWVRLQTAIPLLLGTLFIKGATITINAMGCQKVIAEKIVTGKADYILTVNGNQGVLEMICKRHLSMGGQMMSIPANRS